MKQTEQELATELELLDAQIERLAAEVKNLRAIRRKLKAKMDPTRLQSRCEVNDFNIPTIEEYKNMNKAEKGKYWESLPYGWYVAEMKAGALKTIMSKSETIDHVAIYKYYDNGKLDYMITKGGEIVKYTYGDTLKSLTRVTINGKGTTYKVKLKNKPNTEVATKAQYEEFIKSEYYLTNVKYK